MRGSRIALALALVACRREQDEGPDLGEALGIAQVRAGVVTDEAVLFGGISAEGRAGDVKIYNDRVRFVIQGARLGSYLAAEGGGVIDADVVRPEGQPGRDGVDDWGPMFGLGRLMHPTTVTVEQDGSDGVARVVVEGVEAPLTMLTGTLDAPGVVPDLGLALRIEYTLRPGESFLEVRSTATATDEDVVVTHGDVLFGAVEALDMFAPGGGLLGPFGDQSWSGWIGKQNEVAYIVAASPGEVFQGSTLGLLSQLGGLTGGFGDPVPVASGASSSEVRYYGVGPDLATLTDALLAIEGAATDPVTGVVTAADGPVAGARVNVLVDGAPYTVAVTDAAGAFETQVPAGSAATVLAVGTASRRFLDLPEGAGRYSPYTADAIEEGVLESLSDGALAIPLAEGRGVGTAEAPLALGVPGRVVITAADGLPFEALLVRADPPTYDERLVPGGGAGSGWAAGWARDGSVTLVVEPGTYTVRTHRGIRFERDEAAIEVTAGGEVAVAVEMPQAYAHPGWLLGDPHSHASPSTDGEVPMEDRLIVAAASGIQLHFGSDHDHVADYRPLLGPLGLEDVLASVVSDEVSPALRGHHNAYPLEEVPEEPNNGAFSWWTPLLPDTAALHAGIRALYDHDIVLQSNHPLRDGGLAENADWNPGSIGEPDRWSEDFDAIEVLNRGDHDYFALYLDLVPRGITPAAIGASDAHGYTGMGASATFIAMGVDAPGAYTATGLYDAVTAGKTIATGGPFLDLSILPGSTVTGSATLDVTARSPSWMPIDRIVLYRDGVVEQTVSGSSASLSLSPVADAVYVVVAEGDTPMTPFYSRTPWAAAGAIFVDVAGDGWTPPLPALTVGSR